jgi:hypothetical protein
LRNQQILSWSRNSSNFMSPNIYYPLSKIPPAVCKLRMTKSFLSLPLCSFQSALIPLVFATKIIQILCFILCMNHFTPKHFYRINNTRVG